MLFTELLQEERRYGHGFLFIPVAVGFGAILWFSLAKDPPFWPWFCAFLLLAAAASFSRDGFSRTALGTLGLVVGGMMLAEIETWRQSTIILDSPVTTDIVGVVERAETTGEGRVRYIVRLTTTSNPQLRRPPEQVSLVARARHKALQAGDGISGRARLSPPSGPALPSLHDFSFSAYFDGIGAVGYFYRAPVAMPAVETGNRSWSERIERSLFDLRAQIGNRIRETVPGDAGAFAAAIVTDERRAISNDTVEALRVSGLAHIVAISGLNMALAAGIFFVGLRSILALFPAVAQALPVKKIAAAGALAMVTGYYLISGFGVSAQRAYIMMAVMLVAVLLDRPSISLRNVALSALIIMAVAPSEILGPSFQMSFAATAALVAGYAVTAARMRERQTEPLPLRHPLVTGAAAMGHFVAGIALTSIIGSMSTAMFSVEHFHRIAMYGLAANLAAMPIISFAVMPAGLLAMLLMPFGLDAPFLWIMAEGLHWVIVIAKQVAGWGGDIEIGQTHPWFLPLGVAGFIFLTMLRTRLRLVGLPFVAAAAILFWLGPVLPKSALLVSEDGILVGITAGDSIAANRAHPPDFLFDQWRRARRLSNVVKPVLLVGGETLPTTNGVRERLPESVVVRARQAMTEANGDAFTCKKGAWCAIRSREGPLIVVVEDGRYAAPACDSADLVIAYRARFDSCRSGALMLNGTILRKTGAIEIDLAGSPSSDGWRITTALAGMSRPWIVHRHYDWRRNTFDPAVPEWLGGAVDSEEPEERMMDGARETDAVAGREAETLSGGRPLSDISE